jgi:UDP-glucose 4-epimerase
MILITGGFGFIGSHVARALLDTGQQCMIATHSRSAVPEILAQDLGANLFTQSLDTTDAVQWHELARHQEFTGIVHVAAAAIDVNPLDQVRSNVAGLFNMLDAASHWNVDRVVLASSIGVYAGAEPAVAYGEDAPLPMTGLHGIQASKKILEIIADLANRDREVTIASVRLPAVWGPGGRADSRFFALPRLVHAAVRGDESRAVSTDAIDLLYVKDCARAIASVLMANQLGHTVYNVGSGHATSNAHVADAITRIIPSARITLDIAEPSAERVPASYLDISRLLRDTDYEPAYGLESGIRDYVSWLRAGHDR